MNWCVRAASVVLVCLVWCTLCVSAQAQGEVEGRGPTGAWSERWITPSAYTHYLEARIHYEAGRLEQAIAQVSLALAFDEAADYLWAWRASLYLESGQQARAVKDIKHAQKLHPGAAYTTLIRAKLAAAKGNLPEAARLALRARMQDPTLEEAWYAQAGWLREAKRLKQARRVLEALARRTGNDPNLFLDLGELCVELGQTSCAQKYLRRSISLRPESETGYLRLGAVLEGASSFTEAYGSYVECTRAMSLAPECWFHRVRMRERLAAVAGPAELRTRQHQHLLDEVAAMADALAGIPGAAARTAQRLASLEDPHLLEHFIGRCSWRREGLVELVFYLGRLYERQGKMDLAARSFAQVPKASRFYVESRTRLAVLHAGEGRLPKAMRALDQAQESEPQMRELYLLRAALLERVGRTKQAMDVLEKGIRAVPDDAELHERLSVLAQSKGQHRRALKAMERAAQLAPEDPDFWVRLGDLRLATGDKGQAMRAWRQALDLSTDQEQRTMLRDKLTPAQERP